MRILQQSLVAVLIFGLMLVFTEARFPAMDELTVHEPSAIRSIVAGLALRELGWANIEVDRVLMLDPNNAHAWERRCAAAIGPSSTESVGDCKRAYQLDRSLPNMRAVASAEESDGQFCEAESTLKGALEQTDPEIRRPALLRDEARAALACGDPQSSLTALQQAEQFDVEHLSVVERDPGQVAESAAAVRESLASDHGYLAAVYERLQEPDKAKVECAEANPGSPNCSCELTGNALSCSQKNSFNLASR